MSNAKAVRKVRAVFQKKDVPMTLREIRTEIPELQASEISMALVYFVKQGFAKREKIENKIPKARKSVWQYTYHKIRQHPAELN